ncbi:MAG: long-chain fatty acid--CoA ligase [Chloroflexi bacterium]|nr:long-chain fatty acid--CoA ligase [Chloroflexota bacterium]
MNKPWLAHYAQGVRANLEYPAVPMHHFLEQSVTQYPDRPVTIFGNGSKLDKKLTFRELNEHVNRLANALTAMGVKKGDRVALYLPNCPQYVIGYYATLKLGAIVAPNNPLYVARELEFQVNDSGAETIICLSRFYPNVQKIRANTKLKNVIVANIKEYFSPILKLLFTLAKEKKEGHHVTLDPGDHWFPDVLASAPATTPKVQVRPEDTAVLLYTGGTTGVPKAAEITHRNIVANTLQCKEWVPGMREGQEVTLTALPLYHSYAMTTCMNFAILMGGAMVLIPNPRELVSVLKAIDLHKPTLFPGVPTMYNAINNRTDLAKYDLKSIKVCISGAAGLPVEVQKKFQDLTGASLVEGYGLSESSPVLVANPVSKDNRIGTIGIPWPDTEVKIMDVDTGVKEMSVGEVGELVARGPQVMKGYWNRPDETAKTLRDGWLYTGDIAKMDPDGYFAIVDRKKDMIIVGGFNVYPRDVEEVLYQHPKVLEAVVAGIPDPKSGERVKAYIVLKPGQTATVDEIMAYCKENLTGYKRPHDIEFRDSLPKTMIGKILRRELVEEEKKKMGR